MSQRLKRWGLPEKEKPQKEAALQDRDNSKQHAMLRQGLKKAEKKVRAVADENNKTGEKYPP